VAEHAGQEFLDAFERREVERLEAIAEARKDPRSIWFDSKLWDGTARASHVSPDPTASPSGRTDIRERPARRSLAVSPSCVCCGNAFAGGRSDAKFCGEICRLRAHRNRCGEEAA